MKVLTSSNYLVRSLSHCCSRIRDDCNLISRFVFLENRGYLNSIVYSMLFMLTKLKYIHYIYFLHQFSLFIYFCVNLFFKNTKNLFIHIALIPIGDIPRVHPNILKCLHHSPVAKGYRLVVIASRAMVCKTPTYYLIVYPLASARGCVILRSHILFFLLLILLISHHIQP